MTVLAARGSRRRLGACLAAVDEGIAAARVLGLDVADAEAARREADARLGFASDAALVAIVGGTGVGKSTLLNALAGSEVSTASVRRPTTGAPVAWIPADAREEFDGLLGWLGVDRVREHESRFLEWVGLLDLPDLDSVARAHRERVEELLARVDGVIWVTDPEKYRDAVLHDAFLRRWLPRLDRQLVVLNKADRLGAEAEQVRRHLERTIWEDVRARRVARPPSGLRVVAVSATSGDVEAIRGWLAGVADAKRLVAGRLAATLGTALEELAARTGIDPDGASHGLLQAAERRATLDRASAEVLRLVDLEGAERQAVAATRAVARSRGAGPLGRLTAFVYRQSGRERQVADPAAHLRRWPERGSLAPVVAVLRDAVDRPLLQVPAELRPALSQSVDARLLADRLRGAVDASLAAHAPLRPPASRWWPLLGLLQTLAALAIATAAAWLVLLFLFRPPVDVVVLPALGPVPVPLVLLVAALAAGYVVARLLGWHAGRVGRRWARGLRSELRAAVERAVGDEAFGALDRVDAARRALWRATRAARDGCGRGG